jgi:hypothetical protein
MPLMVGSALAAKIASSISSLVMTFRSKSKPLLYLLAVAWFGEVTKIFGQSLW